MRVWPESKMKIRLGIRSKILIFFLALSLISLGVISWLAFSTISQVSSLVKQNSTSMSEEVARQSISALEDLGRTLIQRRALFVADETGLFIQHPPYLSSSELPANTELREIAVQRVGQTGSTFVYDNTGKVYFDVDPKLVGVDLLKVGGEPVSFASIVERSFKGEASGLYAWKDENGNVRTKYMHCIPVEGTNLIAAAATYIDEDSAPAAEQE